MQKGKEFRKIIVFFVFVIIFFSVIFFDAKNYFYFKKGMDNNLENSNLKWAEDSSEFILKNISNKKKIYLSGERKYLNRFEGPLNYMVSREGIEMVEVDVSDIDDIIPNGEQFFYIKNTSDKKKEFIGEYKVLKGEHFSPVDFYILKK